MQVSQFSKNLKVSLHSIPPMYRWPAPLKRAVLVLSIIFFFGVYFLLLGGLVALGSLLLTAGLN